MNTQLITLNIAVNPYSRVALLKSKDTAGDSESEREAADVISR